MSGFLSTVQAQPVALETLRRALAADRVHHAYLFDGPEGVGKDRTALGLAQALVCERRAPGTAEACGTCSACVRALPRPGEQRPLHPDVVRIERGLYDPASLGRRTPETHDISIDQVRTLVLSRAAFPPHEGRAKVFIVQRAEELSLAAANALLKTLEEPGARTHFMLLSSKADALLPTIRSRTQRVRFGPLPEEIVARLLVGEGVDGAQATRIARLSGGSMAAARTRSDPDASARRDDFVTRALAAVESRDAGAALELAEEAKKGERGALVGPLEALAAAEAMRAREAVGAADRRADMAAARHALVLMALRRIESNASAQLTLESLLLAMRKAI